MPHLSPLNWMILVPMIWLLLLLLMTILWWQQTPTFPTPKKMTHTPQKPWKWN